MHVIKIFVSAILTTLAILAILLADSQSKQKIQTGSQRQLADTSQVIHNRNCKKMATMKRIANEAELTSDERTIKSYKIKS